MQKVRQKGGTDSPELFKHDSMEFALSKNLYDNGILKELQLKSEENGHGVLYFFFKKSVCWIVLCRIHCFLFP